jgi:penicillin amidase
VRVVRRLLAVALLVVLVVLVAGVGLLAAVTGRALPQTSGSIRVAGLDGPVSVHRDASGIARIVADTPHDLFLAQGYVHAQERLWQMEVWRHISAGRLSELFGASTLDTDRFIRTLGWRQAAERDLTAFSAESLAILEAYADGVNAYLDAHRGSFGLPFVVVGLRTGSGGFGAYEPEPWTALDSAAWQKVQAWNLGGNFGGELFDYLADARLGDPTRTDDLIAPLRPDAPVITPSGLAGSGGAGADLPATAAVVPAGRNERPTVGGPSAHPDPDAWAQLATAAASVGALAGLDAGGGLGGDHGIGSNSWVVGPDLSATAGALFANDPHLGLGMPSVWFMNGLHCRVVSAACPYDVVGVSFPGDPGVILGHNARIAWGATNAGPDVQDLFVEELDPADPGAYLRDGRSVPLEVRREEIRVAGGDTVVLEIRSTDRGPIVNDAVERLRDEPPMALRWTAIAEPDRTLEAILGLNVATDFESFRDALRLYGAPAQNFSYADVDGHIGYQLPGYIPVRDGDTRSIRPVPVGGPGEWIGRIAFDDLPYQLDPAGGVIVTANNAAVDARYPHFIADQWDYGDRAERVRALLDEASAAGGITLDEMSAIHADTYVVRADRLIPLLDGVEPRTADGREVLARIRSWDRRCDVDSRGCAAYIPFEFRLSAAIFDDELGPLARDYTASDTAWERVIGLLAEPDSAWWDDTTTPESVESAPQVVAAALGRTGAELRDALGQPSRWRWGRLHRMTLREDTLGLSGIGPLEWYFNSPTRPAPGAAGTVNNLYYDPRAAYPDPDDPDAPILGIGDLFEVTNGPSYRLALDLSDLGGARIVQTTGQSGNPFDRHYGDLVDRWLAAQSVPLPWGAAEIERAAVSTLVLSP